MLSSYQFDGTGKALTLLLDEASKIGFDSVRKILRTKLVPNRIKLHRAGAAKNGKKIIIPYGTITRSRRMVWHGFC